MESKSSVASTSDERMGGHSPLGGGREHNKIARFRIYIDRMQLGRAESGTAGGVPAARESAPESMPRARRQKAYVQAVERNYAKIYGFLFHLAQDHALAEDLTQETFASAWRKLDAFSGRAPIEAWLHGIALNAFRAHVRARSPETAPIEEAALTAPTVGPTMIERLATADLRKRAVDAVANLPEVYREIVVLRCFQGLKYREIANVLQVPIGTVQARCHIALERLRAEFREEDQDA